MKATLPLILLFAAPGFAQVYPSVVSAPGTSTHIRGGVNADTNYHGGSHWFVSNGGDDLSLANKAYIRYDVRHLPHDVSELEWPHHINFMITQNWPNASQPVPADLEVPYLRPQRRRT